MPSSDASAICLRPGPAVDSGVATETVAFSSKLTGQSPGLRTQVATLREALFFSR